MTTSTKTLNEKYKSNNTVDIKYFDYITDFKKNKIQKILKSKKAENINSQRTSD